MTAHAKRLGLFAWIYSGLLVLSSVSSIAFLLSFFGDLSGTFLQSSWEDFQEAFRSPLSVWYSVMFIVILASVVGAVVFIICSIVANFRMGLKLRRMPPPTRRSVIVSSILSLISSIFGGIFLLPFGVALCIYGVWFATNKAGRDYLAG